MQYSTEEHFIAKWAPCLNILIIIIIKINKRKEEIFNVNIIFSADILFDFFFSRIKRG